MLQLEFMPPDTRRVFEVLAQERLMQGFVLIGGTALSIQLGHRLSEDLDFWLPEHAMSKVRVDEILFNLGKLGIHHQFATPAWQLSQARINGIDLLSQSRDHIVDGVKVTFFARDDVPYRYFANLPKITGHATFAIATDNMIFQMKSWLITQRVKSRDLYDLMVMMQRGNGLQDILAAGANADPAFQREYAKEVLVGNVPLDKGDERFESISLKVTTEEIYRYFLAAVNEYEVNVVATLCNK